ncbi:MAG TPA: tetratricopeptide repeat-containing sensor histidine kinase [Puia sp.]|nr:tetratricopeptide repeat-containing sensor histidine kinase [Puia sp.]
MKRTIFRVKRLLPLLFMPFTLSLYGQADSVNIRHIYYHAMKLTEAETDSIGYYARYISHIYDTEHWPEAHAMSLRLFGYYYENKANYPQAIDYYLQALEAARRSGYIEHQTEILADLAAVYTQDMKQPGKAKEIYQECIRLNQQLGNAHTLLNSYINLGAIYNRLGLYDSALLLLNEGLRIGKPLEEKGTDDLTDLYNNLGNTYYYLKKYEQSITYFRGNYNHDLAGHSPSRLADIWLDVLNMADSYSEEGVYDSAGKYADLALQLARQLNSKSKESDSYQVLSQLYEHRGDYKKAWEYQRQWYSRDTALVNGETYKAIAELQEKYQARERENEKLLLQSEINQQKFHYRTLLIMAISLLLIAIAGAISFIVKRRANRQLQATNEQIVRQNERLSELNYEKNSLISIVSHDLSTPFASISMWQQLLLNEKDNLTDSQRKALERIAQATHYGEKLIRHILDVEKAQTNQHRVKLENMDLRIFAESRLDNFMPVAASKNIRLHLDCPNRSLYFLSDPQLLGRMLDNLLSNAIKYTGTGKNVWMSVSEDRDAISIQLRDEGVGILPDELPHLFAKYSKISSKPTNGEASTGLGLAIVKRICEELNGQISCESAVGEGSVFTVVLKK